MKRIIIDVIPAEDQRLKENCGDYFYDSEGVLHILVSDMGNFLYERMVAIHELIEQTMTEFKGISEAEIQAFDELYYKEEDNRVVHLTKEAGWDIRSPYRLEHGIAENIERQIALHCGVIWEEYEQAIDLVTT